MPNFLNTKEKLALLSLTVLFFISSIIFIINYYRANTIIIPEYGGIYQEGLIGAPRYINPIFPINDVDRDISKIIFSGLLKYDSNNDLVADLAENYEIGDNGKSYKFKLKPNLKWSDGQPLNADDILFTIQTTQNQEYKSPLKSNWQNIEVEKIDDLTVNFKLKNVYASFLENTTIGIIPKHIWQSIPPQNFLLAEYNLKPIGSGPYQFQKLYKNSDGTLKSYYLVINPFFYNKKPNISQIIFKFYQNEESLMKAFNISEIDGVNILSSQKLNLNNIEKNYNLLHLKTTRYYALFLNQNHSKALTDPSVREALAYSTDKKTILESVLNNEGELIDSPIPSNFVAFNNPKIKKYEFNEEKAKEILKNAGWKEKNGYLEKIFKNDKEATVLEIDLITVSSDILSKTAEIIKIQWEKLGAKVNLKIFETAELHQNYLKNRDYDIILFGEILGHDPDPYAFWHSSQKKEPGLNIGMYSNPTVDKILEDARGTADIQTRIEKYKEFQSIIAAEIPAIFIYSPYYLYAINKKIKGIELTSISLPSDRLSEIENWYINTKRVFK